MDITSFLVLCVIEISVVSPAPVEQNFSPSLSQEMSLHLLQQALQTSAAGYAHERVPLNVISLPPPLLIYPYNNDAYSVFINHAMNNIQMESDQQHPENVDKNENVQHPENSINEKVEELDEDSVIIDAKPEPIENHQKNYLRRTPLPQRIILLTPNGERFSVGSIISAIPFLPFEVNVPDTVSWMWNGIVGIISGIGQRWPFRPRPTEQQTPQEQEEAMKMYFKQLQNKNSVDSPTIFPIPILMLPFGGQMPMVPVFQPQF